MGANKFYDKKGGMGHPRVTSRPRFKHQSFGHMQRIPENIYYTLSIIFIIKGYKAVTKMHASLSYPHIFLHFEKL